MKLSIKLAAILVIAVMIGVGVWFSLQKSGPVQYKVPLTSGETRVTRIADSGFGALNALSPTQNLASGSATVSSPQPEQNAANGIAPSVPGASSGSAVSVKDGSVTGIPSMMPYPYYTSQYVYKGEVFTQDQAKLDVLKRVPQAITADQAVALLQQMNLQLVNLGSFGNATLDQVTLSQNQDFGYTVTVDLRNGALSINQNWEKWPQTTCAPNGVCNEPQALTANDIPSDDVLIAISDAFMKDHGIPMDSYAKPVVQDQWRNYPTEPQIQADSVKGMPAPMMRPYYYPESASVLYQQVLNGKLVYDQGGTPSGLSITVDIRNQRVSNVYGVSVQDFQSSSYDAITDVQKIIKTAEQGGGYGFMYYGGVMMNGSASSSSGMVAPSAVSTPTMMAPDIAIRPPSSIVTEIALGTPRMAYVKMYDYKNGTSTELYVPAFVFPITTATQNAYQQNVLVPLIAELLGGPYPVPMMGAPGASSGSDTSGSGGGTVSTPPVPPPVKVPVK